MNETMRTFFNCKKGPSVGELIRRSVNGKWGTYEVLHAERRVHVGGEKHMQTAGWDVWLAFKDRPITDNKTVRDQLDAWHLSQDCIRAQFRINDTQRGGVQGRFRLWTRSIGDGYYCEIRDDMQTIVFGPEDVESIDGNTVYLNW